MLCCTHEQCCAAPIQQCCAAPLQQCCAAPRQQCCAAPRQQRCTAPRQQRCAAPRQQCCAAPLNSTMLSARSFSHDNNVVATLFNHQHVPTCQQGLNLVL